MDIIEHEVRAGIGPAGSAAAAEWDARVDSWRSTCSGPAFLRFRDLAMEAARLGPDDRVLDVGCGTGLLALGAATVADSVVALDVSEGMLEALRQAALAEGLGNVRSVHGDAAALPFPDATFDCVVSSYALHHLDHEGKLRALEEARRVLRPGGRLVIIDMMFGLSLRPADRAIIAGKAWQILRKGPAGVVRLARNAVRIGTGRWEHPAPRDWWIDAAMSAGFTDAVAVPLEQEAGMLTAMRPE